jgi:hypothetical protein
MLALHWYETDTKPPSRSNRTARHSLLYYFQDPPSNGMRPTGSIQALGISLMFGDPVAGTFSDRRFVRQLDFLDFQKI